ncbi:MAG: hypothetical protein Kow00108_11430 [Calditrichia bacterium]
MTIPYEEYEFFVLLALEQLGGEGTPRQIYPIVKRLMDKKFAKHPEEFGQYKSGDIIWKNKIRWAREYLKRKGEIICPARGIWQLSEKGLDRLKVENKSQIINKKPQNGKIENFPNAESKNDLISIQVTIQTSADNVDKITFELSKIIKQFGNQVKYHLNISNR